MDDQFSLTNHFTTNCSLISNDDDSKMNVKSSLSIVVSNIDLLLQILLCLPAKSLLVFKVVSKLWLSLISDPSFIRKYAIRSSLHPIPGLFLQCSSNIFNSIPEKQFLVLDVNPVNSRPLDSLKYISRDMKILQSCNGLVLGFCGRHNYHICNPTTGRNRILPLPPSINFSCNASYLVRNFSLAFDPLKSSYYEVIFVQVSGSQAGMFHCHIQIYSSETDSWMVSETHMLKKLHHFSSSGVFWNGSIHWMPSAKGPQLLYFDIDQRLLKTTSMPSSLQVTGENIEYFGVCKGHLYLTTKVQGGTQLDIFELEIDYSGWKRRFHVNLEPLAIELLDADVKHLSNELLGIDENYWLDEHWLDFNVLFVEEIEQGSFKLVLLIANKYISYDLKNRSFKIISGVVPTAPGLRRRKSRVIQQLDAYQFIDSLASV